MPSSCPEKSACDRRVRLFLRLADHHAFARGQPIRLHDDGEVEVRQHVLRLALLADHGIGGGRQIVPLQKALGEALARLQRGGSFGRAKDPHAAPQQLVRQSQGKRQLRSDDHQPRLLPRNQRQPSRADRRRPHGTHRATFAMPALPGAHTTSSDARRLRQSPRDRVLPPTRSDHQNLHIFRCHLSRMVRQPIGKTRRARDPDRIDAH